MLRAEAWVPTKFVERDGRWRGSRDRSHVLSSSRIVVDRIAAAYAGAIREHARGDLLDLGCGHVPLYGVYRDLVRSTTCLDWPNTPHPSIHVDLRADLGDALPLPSGGYDTVVLTDVLEHLPYPDRLWSEVGRLVRPGGHVLVGVPFLYWLHEVPHDYHRYTESRLRLFCADHGFEVVSCTAYGGALDVFGDVLAKIMHMSLVLRWLVPAAVRVLEPLGRAFRRFGRLSMPLGYVLVARRGPATAPDAVLAGG